MCSPGRASEHARTGERLGEKRVRSGGAVPSLPCDPDLCSRLVVVRRAPPTGRPDGQTTLVLYSF